MLTATSPLWLHDAKTTKINPKLDREGFEFLASIAPDIERMARRCAAAAYRGSDDSLIEYLIYSAESRASFSIPQWDEEVGTDRKLWIMNCVRRDIQHRLKSVRKRANRGGVRQRGYDEETGCDILDLQADCPSDSEVSEVVNRVFDLLEPNDAEFARLKYGVGGVQALKRRELMEKFGIDVAEYRMALARIKSVFQQYAGEFTNE